MKILETKIINKYLKSLTLKNKNSLKLKDDVYYDFKKKFVFSTDTFEEGLHFLNSSHPKKFVKKIFRSSVSDVLCKGIYPEIYFLSLSLKKINNKLLNIFTKEFKKESIKFGLSLGGGDIINSSKLTISISVLGFTKKKPILRSTARINDDIYVTGNLGDSYLGLLTLKKQLNAGKLNNYFKNSYEEPKLPFKLTSHLHNFASSSMDISDGLVNDLKSICSSSKCGAHIDFLSLPFSNSAKKIFNTQKITPADIFSKGDDYQVLFTANQKFRELINLTSRRTATKITRIGKIFKDKSVKILKDGKLLHFSSSKTGYIHRF